MIRSSSFNCIELLHSICWLMFLHLGGGVGHHGNRGTIAVAMILCVPLTWSKVIVLAWKSTNTYVECYNEGHSSYLANMLLKKTGTSLSYLFVLWQFTVWIKGCVYFHQMTPEHENTSWWDLSNSIRISYVETIASLSNLISPDNILRNKS